MYFQDAFSPVMQEIHEFHALLLVIITCIVLLVLGLLGLHYHALQLEAEPGALEDRA